MVLVAVGWAAWTFNRLIALRNRLEAAWSDIDALLKRRADLIPNLVESVRAYASHEERTFREVTSARTTALAAGGGPDAPEARARAEAELQRRVGRLFAVVEDYPELRASENILELQAELTRTENDIAKARRYYNAVVRDYDTMRETFPAMIVARLLRFEELPYFELPDPEERRVPEADVRVEQADEEAAS